jgi:creatinine amidohydrolase
MHVEWWKLKAHELRALAERGATVIMPVGSMEQHGPHLPVQVDALLAGEVSRRAAEHLAPRVPVVVTPTVWMGLAEHHMSFGGTFTLDFDAYQAVLRCLCRSVDRHGFPRIFILNGHGGNVSALGVIASALAHELRAKVATVTYWHLKETIAQFGRILEHQDNVLHAGEAESSMLLALVPELVDQDAMRNVEGPMGGIVRPSGAYGYRHISAAGGGASASRRGIRRISSRVCACCGCSNSCSVGATSSNAPACITPTRSHICRITGRSWLMNSIVRSSSSCRSLSRFRICAWMDTSSADTASSQTSSAGFRASARAMLTRWRWPPESSCGKRRR